MARNRRALVIGASGMVGRSLLCMLREQGVPALGTCYSQTEPGLISLDLQDSLATRKVILDVKPSWVFLSGAWTHVDGCEAEPQKSRQVNVEPIETILDAMSLYGGRLLYYSSEYVFDGEDGPYTEDRTPHPLSIYGQHKLAVEDQILNSGVDSLIVRTTWVYGPDHKEKNFVYQVMKAVASAQVLDVPSDQISTPTFSRDLAHASIELMRAEVSGLWHVAGPDRVSRVKWAYLICEAFSLDPAYIHPVSTADLKRLAARPLDAGLISNRLARTSIRMNRVEDGLKWMASIVQ